MSRLRANQITNENANGSPNFPHGLTVTGIVTASSLNSTSTQIVAGAAVTANSGGVDTVGIVTATSFKDKSGGTFAPNPTTTQGDIIVRGASANERLAIGSAGQALKVNSSANGLEYGTAGNASPIQVIEEFFVPCDGQAVVTDKGSVTVASVTGHVHSTASYADLPGSIITYQPPDGATYVIYTFQYLYTWNHSHNISHHRLYIDGNEVTKARYSLSANTQLEHLVHKSWGFKIGGSTDYTVGRLATWNSALQIKIRIRAYSGSHTGRFHATGYFDGASSQTFHMPQIGIKAIGSLS